MYNCRLEICGHPMAGQRAGLFKFLSKAALYSDEMLVNRLPSSARNYKDSAASSMPRSWPSVTQQEASSVGCQVVFVALETTYRARIFEDWSNRLRECMQYILLHTTRTRNREPKPEASFFGVILGLAFPSDGGLGAWRLCHLISAIDRP